MEHAILTFTFITSDMSGHLVAEPRLTKGYLLLSVVVLLRCLVCDQELRSIDRIARNIIYHFCTIIIVVDFLVLLSQWVAPRVFRAMGDLIDAGLYGSVPLLWYLWLHLLLGL